MSTLPTEPLDQVFAALAHPVRRAILEQCGTQPQTVADLARPHALSLNAISKHIKKLESAELVSRVQEGNFHRIRSRAAPMKRALDWLDHHVDLWDRSLLSLKNSLDRQP